MTTDEFIAVVKNVEMNLRNGTAWHARKAQRILEYALKEYGEYGDND